MAEAMDWTQLSDLDIFYYYETVPVAQATEHDIALGVVQPKRSLFYDREDSAGVSDYENLPQSVYTEVIAKYDIASWMARRNEIVGDGENGTKDRRVATSQAAIEIKSRKGEISVNVFFISFTDIQTPTRLSIPLGGGS